MKNNLRTTYHKKNPELEKLLSEMEALLKNVNEKITSNDYPIKRPVLFIVGCARSGTTLVNQYLAHSGLFGYPNNIISRFYYAPYIGVRIHQLLYEQDHKNEIFESKSRQFQSNLGKTFGPNEPHEFWYFWNRFFDFDDNHRLSNDSLSEVNLKMFIKEMGAFQESFDKPLLMKALNMNWKIPFLYSLSSQFFFLYVKRNIIDNALSLLNARRNFFNSESEWYSFKTSNYSEIKSLKAHHQVVEQVIDNNYAIEKGLKLIDRGNSLVIDFESFKKDPYKLFIQLKAKGVLSTLPDKYELPIIENAEKHNDSHDRHLIKNYFETNHE